MSLCTYFRGSSAGREDPENGGAITWSMRFVAIK